jgi:two-component system sensor histidine kinase YesM
MKITLAQSLAAMTLKRKMSLAFGALFFLVLTLLMLLISQITSGLLIKKTVENTAQNLTMISEKLDMLSENVENYTKIAMLNENIQRALQATTTRPADYFDFTAVRLALNGLIEPKSNIESIILYQANGNIYQSGNIVLDSPSTDSFDSSLPAVQPAGKGWRDLRPSAYSKDNKTQNIFSFYRIIHNSDTGDQIGVIETNINETHLSELYANIRLGQTGQVIILNTQGQIVSSANKAQVYSYVRSAPYFEWILTNSGGGKVFAIDGRESLVISKPYPRLGWIITGIVPLEEITADNQTLAVSIFSVGLLSIVIFILLAEGISATITRPIQHLKAAMLAVSQGDLEARAEVTPGSEVGVLAAQFNKMVNEISSLMDTLLQEQKAKKDYEFALLQAQINPHFLYNTLESICGLARLHRDEDVVTTINHLAGFYRGVLGKGGVVISLDEEIRTCEHFLKILQIRYGRALAYEIQIQPEALGCSIVRCSLQPLIENCLQHGLSGRSVIRVRIEGRLRDDTLVLTVSDDGVGMTPETAARALSAGDSAEHGLGLRSVDARIKLYFGSPYGLQIISAPGEGAAIELSLPANRRPPDDEGDPR